MLFCSAPVATFALIEEMGFLGGSSSYANASLQSVKISHYDIAEFVGPFGSILQLHS